MAVFLKAFAEHMRDSVLHDSRIQAVVLAAAVAGSVAIAASGILGPQLTSLMLPMVVVAGGLRCWRHHLLTVPAPDFLRQSSKSALTPTADGLATGVVAADALLALGYVEGGIVLASVTAVTFFILGSLRANLLLTGLSGLVFGPITGRRILASFEDLRSDGGRGRSELPSVLA